MRLTEFLSLFYADDHEPIRLRAFKPKLYPNAWDSGAQKPFGELWARELTVTRAALSSEKALQECILKLNAYRGLYFIVNAGIAATKRRPVGVYVSAGSKNKGIPTEFIEDSDIERYNAFFCEDDQRSIDEQIQRFAACPIPPFVLVVTLKSVHGYWLCAEGVTREQWERVQCGLIAYFGSDKSIKNPSRPMRLPFFDHLSYDETARSMSRKPVKWLRGGLMELYSAEQMLVAFPAPEAQAAPMPDYGAGNGEYPTWEALGIELRRRMAAHPTAHQQGDKIVLQGICHEGKGNSALFFNVITGKYHCDNDGCTKEDILRAFGLPERPTGEGGTFKRRITPQMAQAVKITDKQWTDSPALVDFIARMKSPAVQSLTLDAEAASMESGASGQPIARIDPCGDCGEFGQLYGRLCVACDELRGFLRDPLRCGHSGARRWRHPARTVDGELVPPGFKWHCEACKPAPGDAVWDRARSAA